MAQSKDSLTARVAKLEDDLRRRDEKIKEQREELRKALALVDQMRDQVIEGGELIDQWIDVFEMQLGDDGRWKWNRKLTEAYEMTLRVAEQRDAVLRNWNRFVPRYNAVVAPQSIGRPLGASDAQVKDVVRRRKAGASLRTIATATSLSLRTVRTIVEKDAGTGRAAERDRALRKVEFDRLRAKAYRERKRRIDALPAEINRVRRKGEDLVKASKGLAEV